MFIITAKLNRRRLAVGLAAAAALLVCALAVLSPGRSESCASSLPVPGEGRGIRTNRDRIEFLASCGWEVEPEPVSTQELMIPEKMDEVYTDYLALQSSQGFDLTACGGKRVRRYSYRITNYPTGDPEAQVNLLIRRGRVVGGEVLSPKPDGFLHGLILPRDSG